VPVAKCGVTGYSRGLCVKYGVYCEMAFPPKFLTFHLTPEPPSHIVNCGSKEPGPLTTFYRMDFIMASIASKALDFDLSAVEFSFEGKEPILVNLKDFSPEVQLHFALHGISQKLGDSYSSAKGDVEVAYASFQQTLQQLADGEWRAARSEGDAKPRTTELAEALARIKGQDVVEVTTALSALDKEKLKSLRSNDRVKAVIAVIRAEKAQAKLAASDKLGRGRGEDSLDF